MLKSGVPGPARIFALLIPSDRIQVAMRLLVVLFSWVLVLVVVPPD